MGQLCGKYFPSVYRRCDCCNQYKKRYMTFSYRNFCYCEKCVPDKHFTETEEKTLLGQVSRKVSGRYQDI